MVTCRHDLDDGNITITDFVTLIATGDFNLGLSDDTLQELTQLSRDTQRTLDISAKVLARLLEQWSAGQQRVCVRSCMAERLKQSLLESHTGVDLIVGAIPGPWAVSTASSCAPSPPVPTPRPRRLQGPACPTG